MSWIKYLIADPNKGSIDKVSKSDERVSFPFPCSDSTECTNYIVTIEPGEYKLELWGAQGGNDTTAPTTAFGGRGGFSRGTIKLKKSTTFYLFIGGSGTGDRRSTCGSTGGGGSTDVRTLNGTWNATNNLRTRIIVAGGGGGRHGKSNSEGKDFVGNDGGGETAPGYTTGGFAITGATQNSGGSSTSTPNTPGTFGFAKSNGQPNKYSKGGFNGGSQGADGWCSSGAGGGWWGGINTHPTSSGGSGFVYKEFDPQCTASSDYYLTDAATFPGNTRFVSPYGGTEEGHRGNGFARITNLHPIPSPSASNDFFRVYNRCYSYFVDRRNKNVLNLTSILIMTALTESNSSFVSYAPKITKEQF